MQHVWSFFQDLDRKRTSNGFSANPISYQEMLAYFTLIGTTPDEYELVALNLLDSIALQVIADKISKDNKGSNK